MRFKNVKTIFLDYDGTLHNSLAIYRPAFIKAYEFLVDLGYKKPYHWENSELAQFLGQSKQEMWSSFGEGIPKNITDKASKLIGDTMAGLIQDHKAELYDGALETLEYLKKKGYTLIFLSNCSNQYMENHNKVFYLDRYFDLMLNAEMYGYQPKEDIIKQIIDDYPKDMVMIGDRHHDIKAGKENNLYTIGCSYGFGQSDELREVDVVINDIRELTTIF